VIAWLGDRDGARACARERIAARAALPAKKFLTKDRVLCLTSKSSHP
jgi:hypothetical protein